MTDKIDLDELDVDGSDEDEGNRGDWFWRNDDAAPEPPGVDAEDAETGDPGTTGAPADEVGAGAPDAEGPTPGGDPPASGDRAETGTDEESARVPHVPRPNKDRPVGIPVESGGAGAGATGDRTDGQGDQEEPSGEGEERASGPHGGGIDDMTMAVTYNAFKRMDHPRNVVASANQWADWVGIVGRVDAHVLNKFQRDEGVDLDFFNGTGTGPGERLGEIGEHSMFYAERMVVVGVEGEDEPIADAADWEFVPLAEAAEKAGWKLSDPD